MDQDWFPAWPLHFLLISDSQDMLRLSYDIINVITSVCWHPSTLENSIEHKINLYFVLIIYLRNRIHFRKSSVRYLEGSKCVFLWVYSLYFSSPANWLFWPLWHWPSYSLANSLSPRARQNDTWDFFRLTFTTLSVWNTV